MNQFGGVTPFRGAVKGLVIANVVIWLGLVMILQGLFLRNELIFDLFGLVPARVINSFWIWQPLTYMFVHSTSVFHVLFNMLTLWWFGSELEARWGKKFFLTYYLVCGVGAGILYLIGITIYYLITGQILGMATPLVGASGATYGLLLAFGILFGDRVIHFMMLFPMQAKYFVMIIGLVELITMLDVGGNPQVSNLAHLGGILVGYVYLVVVARMRTSRSKPTAAKKSRRLKLVVDNERDNKANDNGNQGPKYWN